MKLQRIALNASLSGTDLSCIELTRHLNSNRSIKSVERCSGCVVGNADRMFRPFVYVQLENVGTGIVADDIEIVLAADDLPEVDFCDEDCFAIGVRSSKEIAKGIDDATATATHYGFRVIVEVGMVIARVVAAALKLIAGEHEAASLDGDVPDSGEPRVSRVGGRCAVKFDALGIHSGAEQGHIVFPTDNCAEFAEWCRKYRQRRTIAVAPDKTLRSGRHDLAVLAEESAVRREKQHGAIKSACVAFHDANNEINVVGASSSSELIKGRTGNVDAAFPVTAKILTALVCARSNDRTEIEPTGVCGDEGLREQDEFRALLRGFVRQGGEFLDGTLAIEDNG
jgi:hypothetical protein